MALSNFRLTRLQSVFAKVAAFAVLAIGLFMGAAKTEAKLDPYYVLRGQNLAEFRPRILFVVDTSGSMTWRPSLPNTLCTWTSCEQENPALAGRIHGARRAINTVVDASKDQADYSLMTFGHATPPQNNGQVPTQCRDFNWDPWWGWQATNNYDRFVWVTGSGSRNPWGANGMWMLCGDNRPYPYLRHDNLGGFFMPDDQGGDPPPAPLYSSVSNLGSYQSGSNRDRRVQFFPEFVGKRANMDCTDAEQEAIVDNSYGDYGNDSNFVTRRSNVCGRDFYYWPYVDGFAGYSARVTGTSEPYEYYYCNDWDNCWWLLTYDQVAGTQRRSSVDASLMAPFFSQAAIDDGGIPAGQKGPSTRQRANDLVLGLSSDADEGGIDATGGTPWRSVIGDTDLYANVVGDNITRTGAVPNSNAPYSHENVASYLTFTLTTGATDLCVPTIAVVISDGQPSPWNSEGGAGLYQNLSKLRNRLGVKTYVVGFGEGFAGDATSWARLQGMACAAAGSDNYSNPCSDGNNPFDWDTCQDSNNPGNGCAFVADDPQALTDALLVIVDGSIESTIPSGPGNSVNEFNPSPDPNIYFDVVQSSVEGFTESPSFRGHVVRSSTDLTPIETDEQETWAEVANGTCDGFSRNWDAGECLAETPWQSRRIYSSTNADQTYRISNPDGSASGQFFSELDSLGLLVNPKAEHADIITRFLLGCNDPNLAGCDPNHDWKLAGLGQATPVVLRRIPEPDPNFSPAVGIRDPHCGGRRLAVGDEVSPELESFATNAWVTNSNGGLGEHYDYEEAVVVGDDMGLLHAFHLDTGNEMMAFLPRPLLAHAAELAANGLSNFGQPAELENRRFGVSSTINHGWAFDRDTNEWRHLVVFGFGKGGRELAVLDMSHLGDLSNQVDVMWTTESSIYKAWYDTFLGDTWSRPALSYTVPGEDLSSNPYSWLVFGSGYNETGAGYWRGRTLMRVDAMTGDFGEYALVPPPAANQMYGEVDDFAMTQDSAISTYCRSRFWGEMQEMYTGDQAGRLYRWDVGVELDQVNTQPTSFQHENDSLTEWGTLARPLATFRACTSTNEFSCSIDAQKGDPFLYAPAVVAKDRIDEINNPPQNWDIGREDQFLVAMVSGHYNDDSTDGGDPDNDFHSSIYLMADDHRQDADDHQGLNVGGGAITPPGSSSSFMRLALSDITRTRFIEYPDGSTENEVRPFSKRARPIRAPRIEVTGLVDNGSIVEGVEVYYVTFTIYEPGEPSCDPRWYDDDANEWIYDQGSTYELNFRLDTQDGDPFDFINGAGGTIDADGLFGAGSGLVMAAPEQNNDCGNGRCGAVVGTKSTSPCDPNQPPVTTVQAQTIPIGYSELEGFSPVEVNP